MNSRCRDYSKSSLPLWGNVIKISRKRSAKGCNSHCVQVLNASLGFQQRSAQDDNEATYVILNEVKDLYETFSTACHFS